MKTFRQYIIEGGKLNARWSNWLNSLNTEHPNPHIEPSYKERIPKEPGIRELEKSQQSDDEYDRPPLNKPDHPVEGSAFATSDVHGMPIGGFFSISHAANLINTKTDNKKPKPDSLLVSSNRTEEGDLEFRIRKTTFGNVEDIHKFILPAGATTLNDESGDGHMHKPGASHVLSISDASRVIREHMSYIIKTGDRSLIGTRVAEAHSVEL